MQIRKLKFSRQPDRSTVPCAGLMLAALCAGSLACTSATAQLNWENLDGRAGSLAPETIERMQNEVTPPFDVTGTWMIEFSTWRFDPLPELLPPAQRMYDMAQAAAAEGKVFNNFVGQCWPPGMPIVMTRVWPIHFVQLPSAIIMVANFESQIRWIYMDGREHTDPDVYPFTANGESIGHWEGDELVVSTRYVQPKYHSMDASIPISEQFHIIERFRMSDDGERLEIAYAMTDPVNWVGEWTSTKVYNRQHKVDFLESHCTPDQNKGMVGTDEEYSIIVVE